MQNEAPTPAGGAGAAGVEPRSEPAADSPQGTARSAQSVATGATAATTDGAPLGVEEEAEMLDLDSKELEWLTEHAEQMSRRASDLSAGGGGTGVERAASSAQDGEACGGDEGVPAAANRVRDEVLPREKRAWIYSDEKEEGARVYAEFTNGEYYWGNIIKVRKSKGKKYNVVFEDGDIVNNLANDQVYTETQYTKIFEIDPPEPEVADPTLLDRLKSEMAASSDSEKDKKKRKRSQAQGATSSDKRKDSEKAERSASPVIDTDFAETGEGEQADKLSPRQLYKMRCRRCALCSKPDCGLCSTCLRNRNRKKKSLKEVCLRKMCCDIEPIRKAQPAVGFSAGWRFFFEEYRKGSMSAGSKPSCPGLHIVSPEGQKFGSVENAALRDNSAQIDMEAMCQQFRAHIGVSYYHLDPHHFLVGKGYCHEWTDVQGRNNVVFGVISRCSREGADVKFTVVYSDEALTFLNSVSNSFGSEIQRTQQIDYDLAWGGCIAFERRNHIRRGPGSVIRSIDRTMACKSWITPTMRKEELVDYNGVKLPQLTLIVRGYMLVFSVKESTIPNAGYGVFVKCTSLRSCANVDDSEKFQFRAGELLDLGIYAPFRAEDKKHVNVFNLKCYVFSMECEEWCFNSLDDDYMYDITDDKTGKVHGLARLHIPMYINECGPGDVPTVHARLDPEDSVHYLLGISYHGDWEDYKDELKQLDLKADGEEQEVFVNYGADYEAVRIRKGYSTLSEERQKEVLAGDADHQAGFVRDIDHYDAKEVAMSVEFFLNRCILAENYSEDKPIDGEVRDRALDVSRKLHARAQKLLRRVRERESSELPLSSAARESHGVVDDHDLVHTIESAEILIKRLMSISCDRELKPLHETPEKTPDSAINGGDDMDISPDDEEDVDGEDYESDSSFDGSPEKGL